jgi:hypothetical protein
VSLFDQVPEYQTGLRVTHQTCSIFTISQFNVIYSLFEVLCSLDVGSGIVTRNKCFLDS